MSENNEKKGFFRKATENYKDFKTKSDMAQNYFNKLLKPYIQNRALKNLEKTPGVTISGGVTSDSPMMHYVLSALNDAKTKEDLKSLIELLDEDATKIKKDVMGKLEKEKFGDDEIKEIIGECKKWLTTEITKMEKLSKAKLDLMTKSPEKVEVNQHMGKKEVLGYSKIRGSFNCLGWALQQIIGDLHKVDLNPTFKQDYNEVTSNIRDKLYHFLSSQSGVNVIKVDKNEVSRYKKQVQDRRKDNLIIAIRAGSSEYQQKGAWKLRAEDCHFIKYEKTSKGNAVWTEKQGAKGLYMLDGMLSDPEQNDSWNLVNYNPDCPDGSNANQMFKVNTLISTFEVYKVSDSHAPNDINSNNSQTGSVISFDGKNLTCEVMCDGQKKLELYLSRKNIEITGVAEKIKNDVFELMKLKYMNNNDLTAHDFSHDPRVLNAILGYKPGSPGLTCGEVTIKKNKSGSEQCVQAENLSMIFDTENLGLDLNIKVSPYISKTLYLYVETDITAADNSTRARTKSTGKKIIR